MIIFFFSFFVQCNEMVFYYHVYVYGEAKETSESRIDQTVMRALGKYLCNGHSEFMILFLAIE